LPFLKKIGLWIQSFLVPLGGWGLGPAAFADSSFISLAGGVDLWLVTLAIAKPSGTPLYVLAAVAGSVAGATTLNLTMRAGGKAVMEKRGTSESMQKVKEQLEKYGAWAVAAAAMLPPPAPFKLFVVTSGFLGQPIGKFILGLTVGRVIRYSLVGFLASRYGQEVWNWILRAGPWMFALVVLAFAIVIWKRRQKAHQAPEQI
jgi:membrane protein YqaA with SNARE-associated domain